MRELFARLFWIAALVCVFAYTFILLFGDMFIVQGVQHVTIRDAVSAGQHTVTGMVMVPTPCDELTVHTGSLSPTLFTLELTTWQDPSIQCPQTETPRTFTTVAFGPAYGIQFLVLLNGITTPFDLTSVVAKKKI